MTRHRWTPANDAHLVEHYAYTSNTVLAAAIGVSTDAVYHRARSLGLRKADNGRAWTDEQRDTVRRMYPTHTAAEVAHMLGRSENAIHDIVHKMGLRKSPEWIAERSRQHMRDPNHGAHKSRFQKGIVPWNAGVKGLQLSPATQFKPGVRQGRAAQLWQPIGYTRTTQEGYAQRKVRDTGVSRRDYVPVHHLVWRMHGGTIPRGHAIAFRDGNIRNLDINNLELITRADLMRRNSVHNYPDAVRRVMQLRGVLSRQINQRSKTESHPE